MWFSRIVGNGPSLLVYVHLFSPFLYSLAEMYPTKTLSRPLIVKAHSLI